MSKVDDQDSTIVAKAAESLEQIKKDYPGFAEDPYYKEMTSYFSGGRRPEWYEGFIAGLALSRQLSEALVQGYLSYLAQGMPPPKSPQEAIEESHGMLCVAAQVMKEAAEKKQVPFYCKRGEN